MSGNIGDNFGASRLPTTTQQEATALVQQLKSSVGLVQDSLEISFTKLNEHLLWKYQSGSSRPILAPLITVRSGSERKEDDGGIWDQYFEGLKKALPPEIKAKLEVNSERARGDREASLVALGEVLKGVATFLATLEIVGKLTEVKGEENLLLANHILSNLQVEGKAFINEAKNYLNVQAIDSADREVIVGVLQEFSGIIEGLRK